VSQIFRSTNFNPDKNPRNSVPRNFERSQTNLHKVRSDTILTDEPLSFIVRPIQSQH